MYEEDLKKLQNVGMRLNVPNDVLNAVTWHLDKHLSGPKAQRSGDRIIYDLDSFFSFVKDRCYRDFLIDTFEREFNHHACSLIVIRSMIQAMIQSRWQTHASIYAAARHAELIEFYGFT